MNINEVKVPLKTAINLLEQWGNDERAMELLHAILRDLDAEPPKPTPEQLKVLCVELDGSTPRGCKDGDYVWCNVGGIIVSAIYHELIGKLRWHLKDAPTPEKAKHCTRQPEEMEEDPTTTFDSTCGTEPPNPIRETFIKGLGTVRACIDCGVLVSGGPTRCNYCVSLMTTMAPALSKTSGEDSEGSPDRKEGGAGCHAPPQPAQMICDHAGECKADCEHKVKHSKCAECESPAGDTCPLPLAVCVPWGEKVKHYSCTKCSAEREETKQCDGCLGNQGLRRNWTAKQPEPAYTCEGDDTHQDYATAQVGPGTPKNKDPFSFSTWCAPSA